MAEWTNAAVSPAKQRGEVRPQSVVLDGSRHALWRKNCNSMERCQSPVEWGSLENCYALLRIGSSNLPLSAIVLNEF